MIETIITFISGIITGSVLTSLILNNIIIDNIRRKHHD